MLDASEVERASLTWVWVPANAREVSTSAYRVVAFPEHFEFATAVTPLAGAADLTPAALVEAANAAVRDLGRGRAFWYVTDHTPPAGLERHLLGAGADVVERTDVLAVPLPTATDPPAHGVAVLEVTDADTLQEAYAVEAAAFGTRGPTGADLDTAVVELAAGLASGRQGRFVARVDGRAVGAVGWTLAEQDVLRLWGAGTVPEARGRGVYRSLLHARLRVGNRCGARMALTHGRTDTSSPILQRAGFTRYGEKRVLALEV